MLASTAIKTSVNHLDEVRNLVLDEVNAFKAANSPNKNAFRNKINDKIKTVVTSSKGKRINTLVGQGSWTRVKIEQQANTY